MLCVLLISNYLGNQLVYIFNSCSGLVGILRLKLFHIAGFLNDLIEKL